MRQLETLFFCCCRTSTLQDPILEDPVFEARMSVVLPYFKQSPINIENPTLLTLPNRDGQPMEIHRKELKLNHPQYSEIHHIICNCQQPTYFKTTEPDGTFYILALPIEIKKDENSNWEPSYLLFENDLVNKNNCWNIRESQFKFLDYISIYYHDLTDWTQALINGQEVEGEKIFNGNTYYRLRHSSSR